jgi:hypothetical protein
MRRVTSFRNPVAPVRATAAFAGIVALLYVSPLSVTGASVRGGDGAQGSPPPPRGAAYIPADLEDCFVQLERLLPKDVIREMRDAKEEGMVGYHHGLGTGLRNDWGLWRGSRLSAYFNELGIQHPDDMSGIILTSFWRHLHGVPLDVESQVAAYQVYWRRAKQDRALEEARVERLKAALPGIMMGLAVAEGVVPAVTLPDRRDGGLRARHAVAYRGGALLTVRRDGDGGRPFRLEPFFLDLTRMSLRPVRLAEIDTMSSAVVGDGAYFLGRRKGRPTLVRIAPGKREVIPLPRADSIPQLGLDGGQVIAVYSKAIYRLDNSEWRALYQGPLELPWSGPPPLKVGSRIYFRDEGRGEDDKRLWWLELEEPRRLLSLDADCGMVGPEGPRWENVASYAVTPEGDLWAAVGNDHAGRSLLRRARDGKYRVAIMNGKVAFDGQLLSSDSAIGISAVAVDGVDTLLAAGPTGLYRVQPGRIDPVVSFANTAQEISMEGGRNVYHWGWQPTEILDLGEGRYVISGMFGGIYLLHRQPTGEFGLQSLDAAVGAAIRL